MEETLGKRIAANRKRLGLTQDALAEQLGVTAQAVSKWENDQSCPDISTLPRLADIFNVTTDELLGVSRKDVQSPQELPTIDPISPVEKQKTFLPFDAPRRRTLCFSLWLVLTGITAICNSLYGGQLSMWDLLISSGIFLFGICGLLRRFSVLRLACALFGANELFLVMGGTRLGGIDWYLVFAAGILLLGMDLLINTLLNRKKQLPWGHRFDGIPQNHCTCDGSRFSSLILFGEDTQQIQLPVLSGGCAEVAFGQLTIDLSSCPQIEAGCSLQLKCGFGELTLLVSRNCRVDFVSHCAFGTISENGTPNPDGDTIICANCHVGFGNITICYI